MRKTILVLLAATALLGAADYNIISQANTSVTVPIFGELKLTDTVVQDGPLPINRFKMHRLRRAAGTVKGNLVLLPALGNNFQSYLFSDDGNIASSFAAVYAWLGYEVWGYSPRETGISTGTCGVSLDCSPALNWSMQTIVDDVAFIRSQIALTTPNKPTFIGGLSLGAASSLAVVNQYPSAYNGLIAWEGSLVTDNAAIRAHDLSFCNAFSGMVAAGAAVDDQSLPFVKAVANLAKIEPNSPFTLPVPGFPPGLTNRQALVLILSTPNPIAPSPRPGFITAAGDFTTGSLSYSSLSRLITNISKFNDATSNRVSRDLYCSLAGVETTYTNNLLNVKMPVLIIKAGMGFGSIMNELPAKLGSTKVTQIGIEAYAHVDHLGSPLHWAVLELPVAVWLDDVAK